MGSSVLRWGKYGNKLSEGGSATLLQFQCKQAGEGELYRSVLSHNSLLASSPDSKIKRIFSIFTYQHYSLTHISTDTTKNRAQDKEAKMLVC